MIGMMSGTSLDGLDMAYVHFTHHDAQWDFSLLAKRHVPYPPELVQKLGDVLTYSLRDIAALDLELGTYYADCLNDFILAHGLKPDYIASHGHTIFHQPADRFTLQIGNPYKIKQKTGIPVVAQFRSEDVFKGGQGAPLVPVGDRYLFHAYDYCLNLGGISNISYETTEGRKAMDCGLSNMNLNYLAQKRDLSYDADGQIARSGVFIQELFYAFNALDYFKCPPPKSLGAEFFQEDVLPLLDHYNGYSLEDIMNTCVHHNAYQIAQHIKAYGPKSSGQLLITGGGAYNSYFVEMIESYLPSTINCVIPSRDIIDFKEAIVFALLGVLKVRGEINVLSSVTGASSDSCSGILY